MRNWICLIAALLVSIATLAQSEIKGKIIDDKQKPIKGATILLLQSSDSSLVKSALTNELGVFTITAPANQQFLLLVNVIGFSKIFQPIQINGTQTLLPDLQLKINENILAEVTVTAKKPFLEQRADKLVVNVENSATAAGSSALEILQKVPGVIVMNDKITLAGKSSVNILIDGRSSQYTDINQVLASMGASNIEKIELMANPGARYDAAGGAVINIILKKNANLGTNGTISVSGAQGLYTRGKYGVDRNYYRFIPGFSLNHRNGKWNVYGSASMFQRNLFNYNELIRVIGPNKFNQINYTPNDRVSVN